MSIEKLLQNWPTFRMVTLQACTLILRREQPNGRILEAQNKFYKNAPKETNICFTTTFLLLQLYYYSVSPTVLLLQFSSYSSISSVSLLQYYFYNLPSTVIILQLPSYIYNTTVIILQFYYFSSTPPVTLTNVSSYIYSTITLNIQFYSYNSPPTFPIWLLLQFSLYSSPPTVLLLQFDYYSSCPIVLLLLLLPSYAFTITVFLLDFPLDGATDFLATIWHYITTVSFA